METTQQQALAYCLAEATALVAGLTASLGRLAACEHRPTRRHERRRVAVVGPIKLRGRRGIHWRPAVTRVPLVAGHGCRLAFPQRRATQGAKNW